MLMRSVCHDARAFEHTAALTQSRQANSSVITSEDQMLILILTTVWQILSYYIGSNKRLIIGIA